MYVYINKLVLELMIAYHF